MAGSVNKVILVGNLGRDPEVRRLGSGEPVVNLRIATSESWRDKGSGERKERTEWHSVVIFNENLARIAEQYLRKGSTVYIEGQLQTRKWQDQSGQERYTTEVVLQRFRGELTCSAGAARAAGAARWPSMTAADPTSARRARWNPAAGAAVTAVAAADPAADPPAQRPRKAAAASAATWTTRFRSEGTAPTGRARGAADEGRRAVPTRRGPAPCRRFRCARPRRARSR